MSADSLKGRLVFIDALRGIAALSVVLYHAIEGKHMPALQAALPDGMLWIPEHGHLGVAIFFVLSGFVIALSLDGGKMGLSTAARFMLRRSIRLDPPYWVAIVLAIGFSALASALVKSRAPDTFSLPQVAAHLLYLQDLLGYKSVNTVFWTLCLEIQFYLIYAVILASGRARQLLPVAAIVSLVWPLGFGLQLHPGLFLPLWHGFLLGVAVFQALRGRLAWQGLAVYASLLAAAGIARADEFTVTCALTAALIYAVGMANKLRTALDWRALQWLGAVSYSLYLIHNPVTGATFRIGKMLGATSAGGNLLWWALSICACLSAAWAMHVLVERPSARLAKRFPLYPTAASRVDARRMNQQSYPA